jgi:hypothetical protein
MSAIKRKALKTIFAKLEKLLPHLGNANAGEGEAARRAINRLLATARLDWHDVASLLLDKEPSLLDLLAGRFAKDPPILINLALARAEFFCSASSAYADVMVDGSRKTWHIRP